MGRLFWLTGLAGAGKTTIAVEVVRLLRSANHSSVLLDGDDLREVLQMVGRYEISDRFWLAETYARLARLLTRQGQEVVCATISPFAKIRRWLRDQVPGYLEIYIRVSPDTLSQRDKKKLFSQASAQKINNVYGFDLEFIEPEKPDIIIDNDSGTSPAVHAQAILDWTGGRCSQENPTACHGRNGR